MTTPLLSFAPGPTQLHPLVPSELRRMAADGYLSESHRSAPVRREVARMEEALRTLLGIPSDHRVLLVGSATEAMERILQGVVEARSFHLVNGAFARRFHAVAGKLGLEAGDATVPDGEGFRSGAVEIPAGTDLLAMTQNETSTGARISPPEVHALADRIRQAGGLAAVDLVTGWPTEPVDPARIDAGFFSVQKGFGLPAGLGVIVASPALVERAQERLGRRAAVGPFFHIPALADAADRHETVATPNTLAIRLLARVAEAFLAEGGGAALREAAEAGFHRWWDTVAELGLEPFVADEDLRSRTVAVVQVPSGADALRARLRERGLVVGDGYGPWKGKHLRVAHFPVQTPAMQATLLEALRQELAR
ncbi:MAG: alanine--glyoxylate aminotransferase family protein [Gemmatimonadales bacterium]|nr:MAG: alanine--glyoxylate aminotransferase family protein [Gemmatimonadales bacterium]